MFHAMNDEKDFNRRIESLFFNLNAPALSMYKSVIDNGDDLANPVVKSIIDGESVLHSPDRMGEVYRPGQMVGTAIDSLFESVIGT